MTMMRHTLACLCVLPFLCFAGLVLPVLLSGSLSLSGWAVLGLMGTFPLTAAGFAWGVQVLVTESRRPL
jgi:hypothetical protein